MLTAFILDITYDDVERWAITWLPILFLGALVFLVWRTLKLMPRTKPQQITPSSASAVRWEDIAGVEETKDELREVVEFLSRPREFKRLGAKVPKGILLHGPPGTGKTLLAKTDALESGDNVVVMAASNMLEKLDRALLRPGRFDRQVFVPPPDMRGRAAVLAVHTRDKPLGPDVDLDRVARHTSGLTGADLANLCNEAAILAGRNRRDEVAQADFDSAFERVVAGLASRKLITDHEKRVIAWHEAGHALVSELLPSVDKVQKVSIVPRGKALGYTLNLPQEDRYLKSREELIDFR